MIVWISASMDSFFFTFQRIAISPEFHYKTKFSFKVKVFFSSKLWLDYLVVFLSLWIFVNHSGRISFPKIKVSESSKSITKWWNGKQPTLEVLPRFKKVYSRFWMLVFFKSEVHFFQKMLDIFSISLPACT